MLAERIVRYETREKGAMGNLFGFEARDGFWCKLAKTLGPLSSSVGSFMVVSTFFAGPVGVAAAAVTGLIAGGITRAVNTRVISDLHDSYQGNLAKFGHWIGTGMLAGVAGTVLNVVLPVLSVVAAPVVQVIASKGVASGFGDPQLRAESADARNIARQAIQSGLSVDQLLAKSTSITISHGDLASESPEHSMEKNRNFTQMIEQQRSEAPSLSLTK